MLPIETMMKTAAWPLLLYAALLVHPAAHAQTVDDAEALFKKP